MIKLRKFSLKEKPLFEDYLRRFNHGLSAYSFIYAYIWKDFFRFQYCIIEGNFCLFAEDSFGMFLYIEPLGKISKNVIENCFGVMDKRNKNKQVSRIENVEKEKLAIYKKFGFENFLKSTDYVYDNISISSFKGNALKHKRSCSNYFLKHNSYDFIDYDESCFKSCNRLYKNWAKQRSLKYSDNIYQHMLKQSYSAFQVALKDFRKLDLVVKLIVIGSQVKACAVGFKLNKETFCVLFEITDLSIKGLAQFIFKRMAQETGFYKYINVMDDSGLKNIKRVKLSYRPIELIESYNVTR